MLQEQPRFASMAVVSLVFSKFHQTAKSCKSEWRPLTLQQFLPLSLTKLEESTILEVVLNDDICDSIKHKLDVVCISGTSEMSVNLLCVLSLVEILKLKLDICRSFLVCV